MSGDGCVYANFIIKMETEEIILRAGIKSSVCMRGCSTAQ